VRIVHITAGAGGRICGTCLHDNTLIRALRGRGCDALLVPAYVPTTTDEENVAEQTVVMGGVNVWLQEHVALFRHTPAFLDAPLDSRALLDWLSSRTGGARAADLGPLTVSSLEGEHGRQRKEVAKLARWLAGEARPDVVHLSNVLLLGLARSIREATGARIVCSLSGEDVFLDALPEPHRSRAAELLRERAAEADRFVAFNRFNAGFMGGRLGVAPERIAVIPHGVDLAAFPAEPPDLAARRRGRGGRLVIGFLARGCPEKGLDQLVRALPILAARHDVEVIAAGAAIEAERDYLASCQALAHGAEAKGLSSIEAMAAGVPVVASAHGAFPELLDAEQAGLLHAPGNPADLARAIGSVLADEEMAGRLGRHGHLLARSTHSAAAMAAAHETLYRELSVAGSRA